METDRQPRLGDIILIQPLRFWVLTLFVTSIAVAVVIFASLGSYARKETVRGFLSPDNGIVKVHAPRNGVVGRLHVGEAQIVKKGAPLVTLLGERITGDGIAVDSSMLRVVKEQIDEIQHRRNFEIQNRDAQRKRLKAELAGLEAEQVAIAGQIQVQREMVTHLELNFDRIRSIAVQGYISNQDVITQEDKLLTNKQVLANLLQKMSASSANTAQTVLALQRLPLETAEQLSELASAEAELELKTIDLQSQRSITIEASVAGKVTALTAAVGSSVNTQLPLLTILPEGGTLEARLFVPTRAIGFVKIGQKVRLLYDAFDYRHFGSQRGTVTNISSSVFSPSEIQSNIRITEPAYRVTVQLRKQIVEAYGQTLPLQTGMLLRANIILENRSLLHWLLDPLFSIQGRT